MILKILLGKSRDPKEEFKLVMLCLAVVCVCCLLIGLLRNVTLCYQLGKDNTDDFVWKIIPESITLIAMTICSVLIFLILQEVRKVQVFTKLNSNLIMAIGIVLECNGILQNVLRYFIADGKSNSSYMIYILIGVFFLFIACLFKLGIRMQEEQELTV